MGSAPQYPNMSPIFWAAPVDIAYHPPEFKVNLIYNFLVSTFTNFHVKFTENKTSSRELSDKNVIHITPQYYLSAYRQIP